MFFSFSSALNLRSVLTLHADGQARMRLQMTVWVLAPPDRAEPFTRTHGDNEPQAWSRCSRQIAPEIKLSELAVSHASMPSNSPSTAAAVIPKTLRLVQGSASSKRLQSQ